MKDIPSQQTKKRYASLSDSLQNAIFSDRSSDAVRKAAIFGNVEDRVSRIAELTGYTLLGYLNPIDFPKEIQNELGVSEKIAKQIASQIDSEIFSLVSTDLRKLYPPTIKTPTASSYGFAPGAVPKEAEKKFTSGPSEFEKRFFKKSAEQKATAAPEKKPEPAKATEPLKKAVEDKEEKAKPFFEKHEIGEHNLKAFEKMTEEKKQTLDQVAEEQMSKDDMIKTQTPKEENKEAATDAHSELSKKISESMQKPKEEKPDDTKEEKRKAPEIRPVMPLPTFMQSQFQPKRTADDSEHNPKVEGNVIDLRDL